MSLSSLAWHGLPNPLVQNQRKQNKNLYLLIYLSWQALGPRELFLYPLCLCLPPGYLVAPHFFCLPFPLLQFLHHLGWGLHIWLFSVSGSITYYLHIVKEQKISPLDFHHPLQISSLVSQEKNDNGKLLRGHKWNKIRIDMHFTYFNIIYWQIDLQTTPRAHLF